MIANYLSTHVNAPKWNAGLLEVKGLGSQQLSGATHHGVATES